MKRLFAAAAWVAAVLFGLMTSGPASAQEPYITLASTTSTENSGLFKHILPVFTSMTGIAVHVVAVGTGQALKIGENGDADVLLVHDKDAELEFVAKGYGVERRDVMYNDFIVVGPGDDPAGIAGATAVVVAFKKIAETEALFVSRGDDSGTNRRELKIWQQAGIDIKAASGTWYLEVGAGMGATLNIAAKKPAYTLSDRGTWLSFENRDELRLLVEGDPQLFNQYGVMLVNPELHPSVKKDLGMAFVEWITSPAGQATIAAFRIDGEQLFFPDYGG